jgi:hypothetical protein
MSTENSNVKSMAVVAAQAAVTALSFSAFSSAIGTLMASTPMAELPSKSKATKTGLQDLRAQFGNELVDRALRAAGPNDDILSIAEAVDAAFQESLHARFTDFEVNTALNACPPGDMRCVWEVAQALHSKGVKPTTVPEKTQVIAAVAAEVSIKKRSKNAGPQIGKQTIDTRTGLVYKSLAQAVKQTNGFAEYGVNPKVSLGRYQALAYYDLTHPK